MPDTKVRFSDPTRILMRDHRRVKALFSRYEKLGKGNGERKGKLFREIHEELNLHAAAEEKLFYPAVRALGTGRSGEMVGEALEEHHIVKVLLKELMNLRPGEEQYDAKMTVLAENVLHHAREEEAEMFPKARKLPAATRQELTVRMEALKESLKAS
jgi:hemerythrin superfamily protein